MPCSFSNLNTLLANPTNSKSYDFQADVVVCVNGGAKVYKLLNNIEFLAISRDLRPHTRLDLTRRPKIFRLTLIYCQSHFRRLPFDSTKRRGVISLI